MTSATSALRPVRLTSYAPGSGCACKIPPGELEAVLATLGPSASLAHPPGRLIAGLDEADDAAIVEIGPGQALVLTTDFFAPVADDAYDWGRIAATNALSDVYAVGGRPVFAVNLLGWPRATLPMELAGEVLRGGLDVTREADCFLAGGHSVDSAEPMYGLAVTGTVDPARTLRLDAGRAGTPLSLTKPLGIGVLNARHKQTGEVFPEAIAAMTTLNREAAAAAQVAGANCATDVTGFGLLGHLLRLVRASGVAAVLDTAAVPYLDGARAAAEAGFVSGGAQRNLEWVRPHADLAGIDEITALLLADPQTSGGLLVAGEVEGGVVIGELVDATDGALIHCQ